jgi:hypothetical protein
VTAPVLNPALTTHRQLTSGAEHGDPLVAGGEPAPGVPQTLDDGLVQGVHPLGAVDGDHGDVIARLVADRLAHGGSSVQWLR